MVQVIYTFRRKTGWILNKSQNKLACLEDFMDYSFKVIMFVLMRIGVSQLETKPKKILGSCQKVVKSFSFILDY